MFVSCAQNFEDVMLWRALKHVSNGFYIDAGAAWPDKHSVTKAFYERGWHGINIEPNPQMWHLLSVDRRRDINLKLALSDRPGQREIQLFADTGLSTMDAGIAALHEASGYQAASDIAEVSTLSDIWREHIGSQDVHFLKVDVEGAEREVLLGNDWSRNRPWVLVIEATVPMMQIKSHENWESIVLTSNYRMAYDDGLNRFYVAMEHEELLPAFSSPPNVFDNFVTAGQFEAEARVQAADGRTSLAGARANTTEMRANRAELEGKRAEDVAKAALSRAEAAEIRARESEIQARNAQVAARAAEARSETAVSQMNLAEQRMREAKVLEQSAEIRASRSEQAARIAEARALQAEARVKVAKARRAKLKATLSWKLTRPFRKLRVLVRGCASMFRRTERPPKGSVATMIASASPRTEEKRARPNTSKGDSITHLGQDAKLVYRDLLVAINDRKRGKTG